jgi:hypothetical protein
MPTRYGSDRSFLSTTTGGVYDNDGNEVVSSSNQFGSFPLGAAALAQTLFSVPNGTFNLLPPDLSSNVGPNNPLPYWDIPTDNSDNLMSSKVIFDTTTNTYALRLTPGSALSGDTYAITTRSAVISDDNLALRQKAIATLEKVGTYAGATQVNLSLSATYYDALGSAISTQAIGTVFDNGTISSITGFTTAGTAAVGISASYVDLTFTMTATADVTSGISFDINTILLQTSQGAGGGSQSFLVTQTFTSSTTWTVPTGVTQIAALFMVGAGSGGGGGGALLTRDRGVASVIGGGGGSSGASCQLVTNLDITGATTISIGIGAGGAGGAGGTAAKASSGTAMVSAAGSDGASGGSTTFGSYANRGDGAVGRGGTVNAGGSGGSGGGQTSPIYGAVPFGSNGNGGTGAASTNATSGGATNVAATIYPLGFTANGTAGAGETGSVTLANTTGITALAAGGTAGSTGRLLGNGAGGGSSTATGTPSVTARSGANAATGGTGGGGGSGYYLQFRSGTASITVRGGNGGSPALASGSGSGGGGGALIWVDGSDYPFAAGTAIGGSGGSGTRGVIVIAYIG